MPGFKNFAEMAAAQDAGQYLYASFRKVPTQAANTGTWFDLSMSPGNPVPNYYIGTPYAFTPLKQSADGGIRHGGDVAPLGKKKHLRKLMAMCNESLPVPMLLCDYVGFYGFIDESTVGDTPTINTTVPTRHVANVPEFYGPELVADGAVTFSGESERVSAGVYRVYSSAGVYSAVVTCPLVAGATYRCDLTVDSVAAGTTLTLEMGSALAIAFILTEGAFSFQFTSVTNSTLGIRRSSGATDVQISGVSVRQILRPGKYPGLQLMPVVVASQQGGQSFQVRYTNQDGVPGRITEVVSMTTANANGTVLHSYQAGVTCNGPFLPLQSGDTGVRSVEAIRINGTGDVGLFALVLVKPLASFSTFDNVSPAEIDYLTDMMSLPEIVDDAYLNLVCLAPASLSGDSIHGIIETTWG